MKRALEAAVVVALLVAATILVSQWRARRRADESAARPEGPATRPGTDRDPAYRPPAAVPRRSDRGVDSMPMIKYSTPPKPPRHKDVVPPPPGK